MKRRVMLLLLLLLLLGGAIVNVAVAWGCAMWSGRSIEIDSIARPDLDQELLDWWSVRFPEHDPRPRKMTLEELAWNCYPDVVVVEDAKTLGLRVRHMAHASLHVTCLWGGWPLNTLTGECRLRMPVGEEGALVLNAKPTIEDENLIRPDRLLRTNSDVWWNVFGRYLPLRPIWPGFAINTVFYAVVVWLLFAGPFVLRRRRRIRCGLCPKCAYDLRGVGRPQGRACPECGTIVAS